MVGECILDCIDTGVPHAVVFVDSVETCAVVKQEGKSAITNISRRRGTNADFAEVLNRNKIKVRTYERGVEDETLACGTGIVASVLAAAERGLVDSPVDVPSTAAKHCAFILRARMTIFVKFILKVK